MAFATRSEIVHGTGLGARVREDAFKTNTLVDVTHLTRRLGYVGVLSHEELVEQGKEEFDDFLSDLMYQKDRFRVISQKKPSLFELNREYLSAAAFELLLDFLKLSERKYDGPSAPIFMHLLRAGVTLNEGEWLLVHKKNPTLIEELQELELFDVFPYLEELFNKISPFMDSSELAARKKRTSRYLLDETKQQVLESQTITHASDEIKKMTDKLEQELLAKKANGKTLWTELIIKPRKCILDVVIELYRKKSIEMGNAQKLREDSEGFMVFRNHKEMVEFWEAVEANTLFLLEPLLVVPFPKELASDDEGPVIIPYVEGGLAAAATIAQILNKEQRSARSSDKRLKGPLGYKYYLDQQYSSELDRYGKAQEPYSTILQSWEALAEKLGSSLFQGVIGTIPTVDYLQDFILPFSEQHLKYVIAVAARDHDAWARIEQEASPSGSVWFTNYAINSARRSIRYVQEQAGKVPLAVWVDTTLNHNDEYKVPVPSEWLLKYTTEELQVILSLETQEAIQEEVEPFAGGLFPVKVNFEEVFSIVKQHFYDIAYAKVKRVKGTSTLQSW